MTSATHGSEKKQPVPKRSRRRRLVRLALLVAVVLVALRVVLWIGLPIVVRSLVGGLGLECEFSALHLSLLDTSIELRDVELRSRETKDPFARIRYARVDLDLIATLTDRLRIERADVDGLELWLDRDAGGSFNVDRYFGGSGDTANAESDVEQTEAAPLDVELPIAVGALRVHGTLNVRDASVSPVVSSRVEADVFVSDLGDQQRRSKLEVELRAPGCVDLARITGDARIVAGEIDAQLAVAVDRVHTKPVAPYLLALGIRPHRSELSLRASAALQAAPGNAAGESRATLTLRDIAVRSKLDELDAIDEVVAVVEAMSAERLAVDTVEIRGVRGDAELLASGELRVAGVDLVGPGSAEPSPAAGPQPVASKPLAWSLRKLVASEMSFSWKDETVTPAVTVPLVVTKLSVRELESRSGTPSVLELTARAQGVAESVRVRAKATPFATRKTVALDLETSGVSAKSVAPYLREIGLEPTLQSGALTARVTGWVETGSAGRLTAGAAIEDLQLTDTEPLFAARRIAVDEVRIDPATSTTRVGNIEIAGIRANGRRDAGGVVRSLGLRTVEKTAARPDVAVSEATSGKHQSRLPRLTVAGLSWKDTKLHFVDKTTSPELELDLTDFGIEVGGVSLGLGESKAATPLHAWFRGKHVLEQLDVKGTITPGSESIACDLALHGRGIALKNLAPVLEPAGIEPLHERAELDARVTAGVREVEGDLRGRLALSDVRLAEAGQDLFAIGRLAVEDVDVRAGPRVGKLTIEGPKLVATRDRNGVVEVARFRFKPRPGASPTKAQPPAEPVRASHLAVGQVELRDLGVRWRDAAVTPPVDLRATVRAKLQDLRLDPTAKPAPFELELAAPDCLESLRVEGSVAAHPGNLGLQSRVSLRGIRVSALAGYLPGDPDLEHGRLDFDLDAGSKRVAGEGWTAHARVTKFDFRENESRQLLGFDRLAIEVPRLDPAAGQVRISEVTLAGLRARAVRDGSVLRALGLAFSKRAGKPVAKPVKVDRGEPARPANPSVPTVQLDKLDLQVAAIELSNAARANAQPLVASFRISTPKPVVLIDKSPEELPPFELELAGSCAPLVGRMQLGLNLRPYVQVPNLTATLALSKIRGNGLAEVLPELAQSIDTNGMQDGSVTATVHAFADWSRASPIDFDVSKGLSAGLTVDKLEVRDRPEGEVVAGFDALRVDVSKITPGIGDVRIRSVEIDNPRAVVTQKPEGLHALGIVWKRPKQPAEAAPAAARPAPDESPRSRREGELRVDEFVIAGADLRYTDESVTPRMVVPINWTLVELKRFSTRALVEPRPVTFRLLATAGAVELPVRRELGLVESSVGFVMGSGKVELEKRPLFDSVNVRGRLTLRPPVTGWIHADVNALELTDFAGLAKRAGWSLQDGTLDAGVKLDLRGDAGSKVDADLKFYNLSVTEPANGPLSRALLLPVSLDTALWLLKRDNGEHHIPLSFEIPSAGMSRQQIFGLAADSFRRLVTDAIARSPWRVTGAVTGFVGSTLGSVAGLFGIGGGGKAEAKSPFVAKESVEFAPGDTALSRAAREKLAKLAEQAAADETLTVLVWHGLGKLDRERCEVLANPTADECRQVIKRMRVKRSETQQRRDRIAAAARAQYAVGNAAAAKQESDELRALDRELGLIERSLDRVYEHLLPGASRRRERRTQQAAIALGRARLEVVRQALLAAGVERRIELFPARPVTIDDEPGQVIVRLRTSRHQ